MSLENFELPKRPAKELLEGGIININKPQGPTSHQVTSYVRDILNKKCGHSGTLDPNVTGVLPIAFGSAIRIVQALLKAQKEYVCLMHLHKEVSEEKIRMAAKELIGKIEQIPPVRSAVKRVKRTREIHYLEILEIQNRSVLLKIGCESGFYVRKFCVQFGEKLETGANMRQLVRTKIGFFTDKNWITLQELKDAYEFYKQGNEEELEKIILPIEAAVFHLPEIRVDDSATKLLCHGKSIYTKDIAETTKFEKGELLAAFTNKNKLICLGVSTLSSGEIQKQDTIAFKPTKVFLHG